MYDDIAEFTRFSQTRLGQTVADLIRRQVDQFWHAGSPLSSAFLGYGHILKRLMTGVIQHARTGQPDAE